VIEGIEPLFQRIADAMLATIPEEWSVAEFHATFFPDHSSYWAEYVRPSDGFARGFSPTSDGARAVREMREAFRQAGRPLWGQIRFVLRSDGTFNAHWSYEKCDANGDTIWDEEAERERWEAKLSRLNAEPPNPT
jgi:hypothetical protein